MALAPYFAGVTPATAATLPTDPASGKHYVSPGALNQIMDNFVNWKFAVTAGGNNLSGLGVLTFGAGGYLSGVSTVVHSSVPWSASSGGAGAFAIRTGPTATDEALLMGVHDGDYAWIQAIKAGTAHRVLALNPGGGNVDIGSVFGQVNVPGVFVTTGIPQINSGYVEFRSEHVAFTKKAGAFAYYWRKSTEGASFAGAVDLMTLYDFGDLAVTGKVIAASGLIAGTPQHDSQVAAVAAGLSAGTFYHDSTGVVRRVL
jgi:hypothetical protein